MAPAAGSVLAPVSERAAEAFLPLAVSVALSLSPALEGVYVTVTLQDFPAASLVPLQPSATSLNTAEVESVIVSEPVGEAPQFRSEKAWDSLWPAPIVGRS